MYTSISSRGGSPNLLEVTLSAKGCTPTPPEKNSVKQRVSSGHAAPTNSEGCVCVCARARVHACVCVCVCARVSVHACRQAPFPPLMLVGGPVGSSKQGPAIWAASPSHRTLPSKNETSPRQFYTLLCDDSFCSRPTRAPSKKFQLALRCPPSAAIVGKWSRARVISQNGAIVTVETDKAVLGVSLRSGETMTHGMMHHCLRTSTWPRRMFLETNDVDDHPAILKRMYSRRTRPLTMCVTSRSLLSRSKAAPSRHFMCFLRMQVKSWSCQPGVLNY